MKFNKLFLGVLGAMAFTACSSDEPINNGGNDSPNANNGENFVTVSIEMPSATGSRADGYTDKDNFNDGTAAESAVSNVIFFFFDNNDNCIDIQKIDNPTFEESSSLEDNQNPYITKLGTIEVRLKSGLTYSKVAVALNSQAADANALSGEVTNVTQLITLHKDYAGNISPNKLNNDADPNLDFGKDQMMSNSVYYETVSTTIAPTADKKVTLVTITADNIYSADEKQYLGATTGDIKKKYVEIYVERAAARIDVSEPKFNIENDYYISKEGTVEKKTITLYNRSDLSEKEVIIRPEVKGIRLNVLTKTANLIKPITSNPFGGTYATQAAGASYQAFEWNDPRNKRCYWATTSLADKDDRFYFSWSDTYGESLKGFTQYINPNTQAWQPTFADGAYTSEKSSLNTKVMVIAELYAYDKEGHAILDESGEHKPIDLVRYGADYMLSEHLLVHTANLVNEAVRNIVWAEAGLTLNDQPLTAEQINDINVVVSHAFATGLTFNMFDVVIKQPTADNAFGTEDWMGKVASTDALTYELASVSTPVEGADPILTSLTPEVSALVKKMIDEVITAKLADINKQKILYWKGGKTYYYHTIRHQGFYGLPGTSTAEGASDFVFGVVRNHIYKIELNGIYGLGTPVINPGKPINPDRPSEIPPSFISAKINILPWRVVTNNATIH